MYRLALDAIEGDAKGLCTAAAPFWSHFDILTVLVFVAGAVLVALPLCEAISIVSNTLFACSTSTMPKVASNDDDPALPFPGNYSENGFTIQYIRLAKLTNPQLSEHCKTFRLSFTGNKTALTNRLRAFSGDHAQWDRLIPGATNTHKGTRKTSGERKTKPKASVTRRETLFSGVAGVRVANGPNTERSKDLRTMEEKAKIKPWAKKILARYPYDPQALDPKNTSLYTYQSAPSLPPRVQPSDGHSATPVPVPVPVTATEEFFAPVPIVQPIPPTMNDDVHMSSPSPPPPSSPPSYHATADLTVPTTANTTRERTLRLAGAVFLTFGESDIPDPPAVSYATRGLGFLISEWDDASPRWNGYSPLVIKGVSIAVRYWPQVYKYWKGSQWAGVKKQWGDWRNIVFAISSFATIEEFWARYSTSDSRGVTQRLKYTPLVKQLNKERKAEDEQLAAIALRELTPQQLTYRKGSQYHVMGKPAKVAALYRKLKGVTVEGFEDESGDDNE